MSGVDQGRTGNPIRIDPNQLDSITKKLDLLVVLFCQVLQKEHTQRELIELLDSMSYSPKEIAMFLCTTPNTVSVTLNKIRKEQS